MRKTAMTFRKFFVVGAAVVALGVAAGAAFAQDDTQKAAIDAAKAQGVVGEQADGYLGIRTTASPELRAAVEATNAGRRQVYARTATTTGVATEVAAARMFEGQLLPRISSGQWYRNAQGQWVQR
ncbi:YdbL family protein [Brevundimonas sp.]|uniref:YdbL family protein n=1 Tax=Brevundimonas sp. TaxID=1871086 RepID=UPI002ABA8043|nr:YdbL family protein [Brevundimonas sp.]MDZ4362919.1 YdbL family protein [Brevundimonas sp.]